MKILINTSVDDLSTSFKCSGGIKHYSIMDIQDAIVEESTHRNRISILRLLRRALRRKEQGADCI